MIFNLITKAKELFYKNGKTVEGALDELNENLAQTNVSLQTEIDKNELLHYPIFDSNSEVKYGYWRSSDGAYNTHTGQLCSIDLLACLPNRHYCIKGADSNYGVRYYDSERNFISYDDSIGKSFTTPANAHYITFNFGTSYGTTYNNDVVIYDDTVCLQVNSDLPKNTIVTLGSAVTISGNSTGVAYDISSLIGTDKEILQITPFTSMVTGYQNVRASICKSSSGYIVIFANTMSSAITLNLFANVLYK